VTANAEHADEEHLAETAALATALGRDLAAVRLAGLSSVEATTAVTSAVVAWCHLQDWTPKLEVAGRISRATQGGERHARLDIVCARSPGPAVAIEIDRFGKVWSLRKLLAEVDAGHRALWVRWHGRTIVEVPPTVGLVDIAATAGWTRPPRTRQARQPADGIDLRIV
jgi:hypothetical protein